MNILYTAIFGPYDELLEVDPLSGWKYICYTDQDLKSETWEIVKVDTSGMTFPEKACRQVKIIGPDYYLPSHDISVWVDANITPSRNLNEFVQGKDYCLMQHPGRKDIYAEAIACVELNKDNPAVINEQIEKYVKEYGYAIQGLVATGVIVRKHTEKNKIINAAWWAEVERHSRRDQLSFNYVAHKLGYRYQTFPFLEGFNYKPHIQKYVPN